MKKVNFKNVLVAFILTLGFVFTGVEVNAQTGGDISSWWAAPPTGTFVSSSEAQNILKPEIISQRATLPNLSGGAFTTLERQHFYYIGVYLSLDAGKDVPTAVIEGFSNLNDINGYGNTDNATRLALKQEVVALLQ